MEKINLYWYKHNKGRGNFGDELNPYIIKKLTGKEVKHVKVNYIFDDKWLAIKTITKALLRGKIRLYEYFYFIYLNIFLKPKTLLAIGSILQYNYTKKNVIWGSGIIRTKENFVESEFRAVRGFHTVKRINELGYQTPEIVGDPALLLPLINPKVIRKKVFKIGIIPHFQHFDFVQQTRADHIIIIDLLNSIENIVDEINSCELVLSTSLHGIIVAHAYHVPAIWVEFEELKNNKLYGDDVKFHDYFSSVYLNSYKPLMISSKTIFDNLFIQEIISDYEQYLLPKPNIVSSIQKNLLSVAPFHIKKEYIH